MSPEATVVIPTYNRADFVFAAIESVIAQRAGGFELIVIDDGSTDGTWDRLERVAAAVAAGHADRIAMRIEHTENRGVAAARNRGIALAQAPLIAFLDSDDRWGPDKLAGQLAYMRAHRQCAISQTGEYWLRNGVRVNPGLRHRKAAGDIFAESLRTCLVTPSTAIIRRELFGEVGGFDEDFTAAEDYDLWLRILVRHEIGLIDECQATRRSGHRGQLSATVPAIDRFRILALLKLLAGSELSAALRPAVCDVLAEKCAIYAKGLSRRGANDAASVIAGFAAKASDCRRESGAQASAAAAVSWMRAHLKARAVADGCR
jgi:glycosyltransferase involved in cell wall biosynthesis